ncbi:hypothetical protein TNCV_4229941 [Trichonephila clavipes]|nr:hypothetical protein TNCV_4229941 [Trichonephila clavipes]
MRTSSELSPPLLTSTTHQRKDVSALDRFNVHRSPTRWVYSGNRFELKVTDHESVTLTTRLLRPHGHSRISP